MIGAQTALWFYDLFPFRGVRVAAVGLLGISVLTLSMLLIICVVRSWRYFYFPVKEQLTFTLECLATVPFVTAQLAFAFLQSKSLVPRREPQYMKYLYRNTIYILFFHDFVYAWALGPFGGMYSVFAFTQFIVHTLMLALDTATNPPRSQQWLFRAMWLGLLAQHVYTITNLFEYTIVRGLTYVYIVAVVMYLANSYLQSRTQKVSTSTKQ